MSDTFADGLQNSDSINTVAVSKSNFSNRVKKKVQLVWCFQHISGHSSDQMLIYSAVTIGIKNSPITKRDIMMMLEQLG